MARAPLLLLAALPILAACSPAIVTPIKLSEIVAVGDTGEPRQIDATLRIPLPVSAGCKAEIATHVKKLAEIMPASGGACYTDTSAPHAEIDTKVWIIRSESERPEKAGLILEVATATDRGRVYDLTVFSRVTLNVIERQLGMDDAVTDPEIVFGIDNDLGRDMGVQFSGAFYQNRPAKADAGILLADKEKSLVQLSDVSTAVVAGGEGGEWRRVHECLRHSLARRMKSLMEIVKKHGRGKIIGLQLILPDSSSSPSCFFWAA